MKNAFSSKTTYWLASVLTLGLLASIAWQWSQWQNLPADAKSPAIANRTEAAPVPMKTVEPEKAATPALALSFLAVGDMGSGSSHQKAVANQLARQAKAIAQQGLAPFPMLLLGDIIYPVGNFEQDGQRLVTDMYAEAMKAGARLKPSIGNHDYAYQDGASYLRFFKQDKPFYYQSEQGPVAFFALDTNNFDAMQAQWLDKALSQSTKPWTVVFGHHPIYSSGEHGNHRHLIKNLLPLLNKHKVDYFLTGHDHNYERFAPWSGGTIPVVSGGGGAYLREIAKKRVPGSQKAQSIYHYLRFDLNQAQNTLQMSAWSEDGTFLDCQQISKADIAPAVTEMPLWRLSYGANALQEQPLCAFSHKTAKPGTEPAAASDAA